jgi:hypothetical protein
VTRVTGALHVGPDVPSFSGGVAHVRLEAIGPADAPSRTIASVSIPGIAHRLGEQDAIPFAIGAPEPLVRGRHALRAWLDRDGSGRAASGDLFSTERVEAVAGVPLIVRLEDPTAR